SSACIVADLNMPDCDGPTFMRRLAERRDAHPVIFVGGSDCLDLVVLAMRAGAFDVLDETAGPDDMMAAIALARRTGTESRRRSAELDIIHSRLATLSPREGEVFNQVVAGRLNKQIAHDLGIVEKTVKVHRCRVMQKLAVRSVAELVRLSCTLESSTK